MTQESTMICVDNSEWMRNGDLPPTRFNCQQEAVRALIHFKLRSNPENAVGLVSLANRIDVLNSLTAEDRKLMVRLHSLEILGISKVFDGLKTAYLALKHRKNRNHRQRIVVFVGSPLDPLLSEKEPFLKFAKKLKKEKVSADFVLFGEATAENNKIIADFVDILNGAEDGASHLLVVPVGDTKLFDALIRSPICNGAAGAVIGAGGDFGINEEDDPELAMALRISLEEQRLRQQQQADGAGQQQQNAPVPMEVDQQQSNTDAPTAPAEAGQRIHQEEPNLSAMTEEEQLEYVLRLSMSGNQPAQGGQDGQQNQQQSRSPSGAMSTPAPTPMELEEGTGGSNAQGAAGGVQLGDLLAHPEMLRQMVGQAPVAGGGAEGTSKERQKESKESDEKGGGAKKEANENNEKKGKEDKKDGNANDK